MAETTPRNPATQKQAKTWLTPEQIEHIRDACLSESFATYLQDRNETLIVPLIENADADAGEGCPHEHPDGEGADAARERPKLCWGCWEIWAAR